MVQMLVVNVIRNDPSPLTTAAGFDMVRVGSPVVGGVLTSTVTVLVACCPSAERALTVTV